MRIAGERAGRLKIAKLNVDENPVIAARFAVQAIPTMIVFRGPLQVDQIRGALPSRRSRRGSTASSEARRQVTEVCLTRNSSSTISR